MNMLLATVALIISTLCVDNSLAAVLPPVSSSITLKEIWFSGCEANSYLDKNTIDKILPNQRQEESPNFPKLYPNPAKHQLHIEFILSLPAHIQFNLLSNSGQVVRVLTDEVFTVGKHYLETSLQNIPSGFYFVQYIQKGKTISTQRVQIF